MILGLEHPDGGSWSDVGHAEPAPNVSTLLRIRIGAPTNKSHDPPIGALKSLRETLFSKILGHRLDEILTLFRSSHPQLP